MTAVPPRLATARRGPGPVGVLLLAAIISACAGGDRGPSPSPSLSPSASVSERTREPTSSARETSVATMTSAPSALVGECDYEPGAPVAEMPPEVVEATPAPVPTFQPRPAPNVDRATTEQQLEVLDSLAVLVPDAYFDPALNGRDWTEITERYRTLVAAGVSEDDFGDALNQMIAELGDEHSFAESPDEVREADALFEGDLT